MESAGALGGVAIERPRLPVAGVAPSGIETAGHTTALRRPLWGRLADERTGEPLPWFPLEVRCADEPELAFEALVTDASGRFTTAQAYAPGAFEFAWLDPDAERSWYDVVERVVADLALEQEFRVPVGPTYQLAIGLPPEFRVSEFFATLSSQSTSDFERLRTPLREGPLPWVRFQLHEVLGAGTSGPWHLGVLSGDGTWWGDAEVLSCVGRYPEVVTIDLEARGTLRGTVRDARGAPVELAWARLDRPDGGYEDRRESWYLNDGQYEFQALAQGPWRLEIDPDHHESHTAEVKVEVGRVEVYDVTVADLPSAGAVSGWVTSATGMWDAEGTVSLWGYEGEGTRSNRRSSTSWELEGERLVHRFAFEDVPAGTYRLHFHAWDCNYEILPAQPLLVTVPTRDIEILVRDDVPTVGIAFRVHSSRTGQELPSYDVWWRPPDGWAGFVRGAAPGATVMEDWPREHALAWAVSAPGYGLAVGELPGNAQDDERWLIDVLLEPGFGAQFFVSEVGGGVLEGIRLAFDGVEPPPSDANGRIPLSAPERPRRIEVRTPGWRIAGGDVDPEARKFDYTDWWALEIKLEALDR